LNSTFVPGERFATDVLLIMCGIAELNSSQERGFLS